MQCWMNGQFVESSELMISPFDHGFLYGLGFFETFRTYDGKVPFFKEHYKRLQQSLAMYHVALSYNEEELLAVVEQLQLASAEEGYFRLNVSAGVHDIGLQPSEYEQPTVIIFRKPLMARPRGQEKALRFLQIVRNTAEGDVRVKSHHYGNNVLARFEMPNLADYEGVFCTNDGHIAEGITSNIFWVKDDILYTPSLQTGILNGITRQKVMRLANDLELEVQEGLFTKQALLDAEECFCTNAVQELVPISHIEDTQFAGSEGLIYTQLHDAYVALL